VFRFKMIKNVIRFFIRLPLSQVLLLFWSRSIYISRDEKSFIKFLKFLKKNYQEIPNSENRILLVPLMDDLGTMKVSIELAYKIAHEKGLKIKYYYVHSAIDSKIDRENFFRYSLQQFQNFNYFLVYKLCRIYGIKRKDIIISNYFWPEFKKTNQFRFDDKKKILDIKFQNISIGELIYDTYLRFRSQYTLNMEDSCLNDIIVYSKNMVEMWSCELDKHPVKSIILPYSSYIHWGIPVNVSLEKNIEVLTYGSFSYVLSSISKEHPYHSKNFHRYIELFSKLKNPNIKRRLAEETLDQRLNGIIDAGTYYMKRSAFESKITHQFSPGSGSWCVVFLHCFFDSPHIYGESLFPDFYEWLIHILLLAKELPHQDYYFKEHPNALPENKRIVQEIKDRFSEYSNIIFLSAYISNKQIIEQKPSAIFTVYGTVAHEFASLGVPVIVAGENPQSEYGFIHKPESIKEFDHYIRNFSVVGLPESYRKEEIYEFFYMHFLYYSEKFDASNFSKQLDLNKGIINLPNAVSYEDLIF
jgi:hypothetical protein